MKTAKTVNRRKEDATEMWRVYKRKLICTKCNAIIKDWEPHCEAGEFVHPDNGCANANKLFSWDPGSRRGTSESRRNVHGIQHLVQKKHQRARKRGAKLARKHRG